MAIPAEIVPPDYKFDPKNEKKVKAGDLKNGMVVLYELPDIRPQPARWCKVKDFERKGSSHVHFTGHYVSGPPVSHVPHKTQIFFVKK